MNMAFCIARFTGLIALTLTSVCSGFDPAEGRDSDPQRGATNHYILCCANAGTWTATADMHEPRSRAVATLLPDGAVLVAGGTVAPGAEALASAELYDPATGGWSFTGDMYVGRTLASATLLADSRFLVVGGLGPPVPGSDDFYATTRTAMLYDAGTGRWNFTASLDRPRAGHTATLLRDGRVLVTGGQTDGASDAETLDTNELYDPSTGTWGSTGRLTLGPRVFHTATLLPDGTVLVIGGWLGAFREADVTSSCELFDPSTGQWRRATDMGTARVGHTATALPNGNVLVVGGWGGKESGDLASAELFDPTTGLWTPTGNLNEARNDHTATLLPNGNVLAVGGAAQGDDSIERVVPRTEVYDTATGTWQQGASLVEGRFAHTATLLPDGTILVAGGMEVLNATVRSYQTGTISGAERYRALAVRNCSSLGGDC